MNSGFVGTFQSMPTKAKLAFYTAVVFALLLVLAGNGYAATPSKASLSGKYAFQISTTKEAFWSNTKECATKNGTNTYNVSNWSAYTELVSGVATFNGDGSVSVTLTQAYQVDQDASDATITITCTSTGYSSTGGNIVFEPAQSATATGTYTVESNGTGTMTLTEAGQGSITIGLQLAGFGSNGVASTALLVAETGENNEHVGTGVAFHE
jgi:hypothetical protein